MTEAYARRVVELQRRMADDGIDVALFTDADSIRYLAGYWGYFGIEFGRPTMLMVARDGPCVLVTPTMEAEMARLMSWIGDIRGWSDGVDGEWQAVLARLLPSAATAKIAVERLKIPALIAEFLRSDLGVARPSDISLLLGAQRVIKDAEEISILRQAGSVAVVMAAAMRRAMAAGAPEYELSLAAQVAGTRAAAALLSDAPPDRFVTPVTAGQQCLQSGTDTSMAHRRASTRRLQPGDPVNACFCTVCEFRRYRLGFDRQFFLGSISDEHARAYETALAAQTAALAMIRPGAIASEVHAAAEETYRAAGCRPGYRTGRSVGCSYVEEPEIKKGIATNLRPGMVFAVDGGVAVDGSFGMRISDSIVVNETGFEFLTPYPRGIDIV